ncbi:hypothetical protein [Sphaerotilus uruguayifluvii]|uniref:Uncharacterized protein n=1 Tax=Sphaerotilus uruguayifluvii TaxID=2735897 RepID=A0ABX2G418_9BURK|nr:hypothetical protein [Leptothrix sp. C29]NRT56789.1 hypothetical protein [Leptothrix sp. C29]
MTFFSSDVIGEFAALAFTGMLDMSCLLDQKRTPRPHGVPGALSEPLLTDS